MGVGHSRNTQRHSLLSPGTTIMWTWTQLYQLLSSMKTVKHSKIRLWNLLCAKTKRLHKQLHHYQHWADQNKLIFLTHCQHTTVATESVKRWSQKLREALRDFCDITDWDVLCDPPEDHVTIHQHLNNKPWLTGDLEVLLNDKKRIFESGGTRTRSLKRIQWELKAGLRRCKESYTQKLESKLHQKPGWGIKQLPGFNSNGHRQQVGSLDKAKELDFSGSTMNHLFSFRAVSPKDSFSSDSTKNSSEHIFFYHPP